MTKLWETIKANKWFAVAYVVFILVFWFWGTPEMNKFEAYFGLVALHIVYAFLVWIVKNILKK